MNVLWIINIPIMEEEIGYVSDVPSYGGGWLEGSYMGMVENNENIHIKLIFPAEKREIKEKYDTFTCKKNSIRVSSKLIKQFETIYIRNAPDIIHIWGTEFAHSLAATEAAKNLGIEKKITVSIQGMVSVYAMYYYAEVPFRYRFGGSINELVHITSMALQKQKFIERGKLEEKVIQQSNWVIGRTDWDKACTYMLNNRRRYLMCNENLRHPFYIARKWDIDLCDRHRIFFSQAHYPIKGFHKFLLQLPKIVEQFPDTKVYVAGKNLFHKGIKKILRESSYERYLYKICTKYKLFDYIFFTGFLNAEEMVEQYLSANVFVCTSSIENSPNSVGEAMILGVPVMAADVGGVRNLMKHDIEGYLYPWNENYMISYYISKIFTETCTTVKISEKSIKRGEELYDFKINNRNLNNIYSGIIKEVNNVCSQTERN